VRVYSKHCHFLFLVLASIYAVPASKSTDDEALGVPISYPVSTRFSLDLSPHVLLIPSLLPFSSSPLLPLAAAITQPLATLKAHERIPAVADASSAAHGDFGFVLGWSGNKSHGGGACLGCVSRVIEEGGRVGGRRGGKDVQVVR
jgi:hypothetical protein